MEYPCVVCEKDVQSSDRGFQCDVCDQWEHVDCIRKSERPDEALYEELVKRPSKALLFMCTHCRQKGSIMKHFMHFENEVKHAQSEQLASARLLEQSEARAQSTAEELTVLKEECATLRSEVKELLRKLAKVQGITWKERHLLEINSEALNNCFYAPTF